MICCGSYRPKEKTNSQLGGDLSFEVVDGREGDAFLNDHVFQFVTTRVTLRGAKLGGEQRGRRKKTKVEGQRN